MKKTLIALAVLGMAGAAYAQSNVTVYGAVDIGYKKDGTVPAPTTGIPGRYAATTDGWTMAERYNTRLGVMGTENLGGGLKATFQVEQRMTPMAGAGSVRGSFEGAANVGLSGSFGQVRFGRLNELSTETYRRIDPFDQYGVAQGIYTPLRGENFEGRLGHSARWDSPNLSGFKLGATYSLKSNSGTMNTNGGFGGNYDLDGFNTGAGTNNGFGLSGTYSNGPLYLVANYNKATNSADSYNWNLGASYVFGPVKVSAGYEQTELKMAAGAGTTAIGVGSNYETMKNWIVGAAYTIGAGVINASYNSSEWNGGSSLDKWAVGYTHNLSKRTSLYANYANYSYEGTYRAGTSNTASSSGKLATGGSSKTSALNDGGAIEVGITHKF